MSEFSVVQVVLKQVYRKKITVYIFMQLLPLLISQPFEFLYVTSALRRYCKATGSVPVATLVQEKKPRATMHTGHPSAI